MSVRLQSRNVRGVGEHVRERGVVDHVFDECVRKARIDRHGDGTGAHDAEEAATYAAELAPSTPMRSPRRTSSCAAKPRVRRSSSSKL
jgi:hypothetical protein